MQTPLHAASLKEITMSITRERLARYPGESERDAKARRLCAYAVQNWSEVRQGNSALAPGLYPTELRAVTEGTAYFDQAAALKIDDPELRAVIAVGRKTCAAAIERQFAGNRFVVVLGVLFFVIPGLLYWHSGRARRYSIYKRSAAGKNQNEFGFLAPLFNTNFRNDYSGMQVILSYTAIVVVFPFLLLFNYYRNYMTN